MKNINIKKVVGKILLYAIVGISCFALWYIIFAFVLNEKNSTFWLEKDRALLIVFTLLNILSLVFAIELKQQEQNN